MARKFKIESDTINTAGLGKKVPSDCRGQYLDFPAKLGTFYDHPWIYAFEREN